MIEVVEIFKHLRTIITNPNEKSKEIKARITASNRAYFPLLSRFKYSYFFKDKNMHLQNINKIKFSAWRCDVTLTERSS